jgi:hypothetical protein
VKNVGPSENISAFSPGVILNRFVHERILKENVECNTPFLNEFKDLRWDRWEFLVLKMILHLKKVCVQSRKFAGSNGIWFMTKFKFNL